MKIVAISREYAAGGHTIGREVAGRLGIEIYDKDIIRRTVELSGIDYEEIKASEESLTPAESFIRKITPVSYDYKETLFRIEKAVILDLAKNGPCVFLGRCADVILSEAGIDVLKVFLYSDELARGKRAAELLGTSDVQTIRRQMIKDDQNRKNYCSYYTGKQWGDYRNYDMMLNTGVLGFEKCVEMICSAAET